MNLRWEEIDDEKVWEELTPPPGLTSVYHSWNWRKVLLANRQRLLYLGARDNAGRLVCICPFSYDKYRSPLLVLDSLSHSDLSGPLTRTDYVNSSNEIVEGLRKFISRSISRKFVISLIIRVHDESFADGLIRSGQDFTGGSGYFFLDLNETSPSKIWNVIFGKHERRNVKFYEELSAEPEIARVSDQLADFYPIYYDTMKRQGYKIHDKLFLANVCTFFPEEFKVISTKVKGQTFASTCFILSPKTETIHLSYVGYQRTVNSQSPLFFSWWNLIKWASDNKYRYINFGNGSSDPSSPNYKFKNKFGGKFHQRFTFAVPTYTRIYSLARMSKRKFIPEILLISHFITPGGPEKFVLNKLNIKFVPESRKEAFRYPTGAQSAFCMSIDFDVTSPDRSAQNSGGTGKLIEMSEKYGIPMTWAICGKTAEEYESSYRSILDSHVKQEIGVHTYGHVDVSKISGQKFEEDLEHCIRVMRLNSSPKSFVFPWNREGHFDVLSKKGFIVYRGSARLISPPIESDARLWNIPGAYHADRGSPYPPSFIKKLIDLTVENHSVFHLWLHPWDLYVKDAEISQPSHVSALLESVLPYICEKSNRRDIYISTMGELGDLSSVMRSNTARDSPSVKPKAQIF